ncbi:hypothetical protein M8J76_004535 [Diaphorina citri]|nr:hypothetical protein M8J76_004535 [Diaphorina citri]
MDVFMKNKAIYLQFDLKNHTDIREKNATIDYLYHIRKNIDTACATKVLLANTMLSQYKRQQFVKVSELFQFAQFYSMEFKRICGELPRGLESPFKVTLVEEPSLGDRIAQNIYDNHPRVAVDLEGYNLGQFGLITLCQVSVSPDHVYLFDILKCPYFLRKGVLKKILETRKVTKVLHGIAGDVANLYRQFNITLRNVYDTQAAFQGMQEKYPELRMGYDGQNLNGAWRISLNELMALYKFDTNQIKGAVKSLYRGNPNLWSYRPLCPALLHYAGEDVNMLLKLQDAIMK